MFSEHRILPLGAEEFSSFMSLFEPFEPSPHLAVGVSGGADSLCLTLMLHRWVQSKGGMLTALTVDHGLRAESAAEAQEVKTWLSAHGIAHEIIRWEGEKPRTRVQEKAREARLHLLESWCHAHQVLHLCLAHHAGDQAETVVMRLAHKSGVYGLSGMRAERLRPAVRLLRPLLAISPDRLKVTLRALGQVYLSDPSNHNLSYERVRWRQWMEMMPPAFGQECLRAQEVICRMVDQDTQALLSASLSHSLIDPSGYAWLEGAWVDDLAPPFKVMMLRRTLTTINGSAYPPREMAISNLIARLSSSKVATLHGCIVVKAKDIWIGREQRSCAAPQILTAGMTIEWDGRFVVSNDGSESVTIGPLGRKRLPEHRSLFPQVPAQILWSLPTVHVAGRSVWAKGEKKHKEHKGETPRGREGEGQVVCIGSHVFFGAPPVTLEFNPRHSLFV